ncbi:MAG: type II/IV secretion system protein [Polyangiaceae bacterium]|nr:type II/IV secretion system protein [Polyangiaceae bacterium]
MLALEEQGGVLRIATSGPLDEWTRESLERVAGKRIELVISSKTDVERLITEFYGFRQSVQRAEQQISTGIDLGNLEQFGRMKSEQEIEASDEHVVHAVDYMFRYAFGQRASDIHIEPKRDDFGGALPHRRLPPRREPPAAGRAQGRGQPHQDAVAPRYLREAQAFRTAASAPSSTASRSRSACRPWPVAFGEKVVMRIFDPAIVSDDLATLGFFERDKRLFDDLIQIPHGIFLVTGPTGSGKTTTLYTALRKLATEDVNITTIEDPIENVFEGLNQTAIHPHIGLGFAEILRTILRQDPDIIMVGEIRDLDTARHAIQAALTGHLVFSTLHTNDAASAITRLLDPRRAGFLLASTLAGVMAQRLVKKVCPDCGAERVLSADEATAIGLDPSQGELLVHYGAGCATCRRTGYLGRSAIVELFKVTPTIRRMIHDGAGEGDIKEQAKKDGMLTLREAAVRKMLLGETTYEQVVEVTSEDMA